MSNLFGHVKRVQPGELLSIQADGWEDRQTLGVFLALREFCPEDEVRQCLTETPQLKVNTVSRGGQMIRALMDKGFLVQVRASRLDLFLLEAPKDITFEDWQETAVEEAELPAPIPLNEAMAQLPG